VGEGVVGEVAGAPEEADEDVFCRKLGEGLDLAVGVEGGGGRSYVGDDCHGDYESWECQAVANFLHCDSCRA
jgi:hypothetical protein